MRHNIFIACPLITTFIVNCYMESARLFVAGNHEIKLRKGTIQGDPTTMGAYALCVTPIIHFIGKFLFINEHRSKEVAFTDDFTQLQEKQARSKHIGIFF